MGACGERSRTGCKAETRLSLVFIFDLSFEMICAAAVRDDAKGAVQVDGHPRGEQPEAVSWIAA